MRFKIISWIFAFILLAFTVSANPHITVTGTPVNNTVHGLSFSAEFETPHLLDFPNTTARMLYTQGLATVGWEALCQDDGEYASMSSCWTTTTNIAVDNNNIFRGAQSIKGQYNAGDIALKYDPALQVFMIAEFYIAQQWNANAGQPAPYADLTDENPYAANWYRVRRSSASAYWEEERAVTGETYNDLDPMIDAAGGGQAGTSWDYFELGGYGDGYIFTLGQNWTIRDNVSQDYSGSSYIDYFNLGGGTNSLFYIDNIRFYNTTPTLNTTASVIAFETVNFADAFNTVNFFYYGTDAELMFSCNNNTPTQRISVNNTESTCTGSQLSQQLTAWINLTTISGNITFLNITVREDAAADSLPPTINTTYPEEGEHINTDFSVIGWAADETGVSNVTINITGMTLVSNQTGTGNLYISYNFTDALADGHYVANVTVNDTSGNTNSSVVSFTVDTVSPEITITLPANNSAHDESISTSVSCSDDNPFLLNYTLYQDDTVVHSAQDGTAPLSLSESIDVTGSDTGIYFLNISCSDTHTLSAIDDYEVSKDVAKKEIIFNGISIKLISSDVALDIKDIQYKKLTDRYTFDFGKSVARGSYVFEISSPFTISHITPSFYLGHLVTGSYWIDFENDDPASVYRFTRINNNVVRIELTTSSLNFASIGGLNVVQEFLRLYIDHDNPNTVNTQPIDGTNTTNTTTSFMCNATGNTPTALKNISIYFNGSLNSTTVVSRNTDGHIFTVSLGYGFYNWSCEACNEFDNCNLTIGSMINVNVTAATASNYTAMLSYATCDTELSSIVMLIMMVIISIILIIVGMVSVRAIGAFGAFLLMVSSWYFSACFAIYGYILGLMSIFLVVYFMFKS